MSDRSQADVPAEVPETPGIVIGNHCHKYTTGNPAIRWLTNRWLAQLDTFLDQIQAVTPAARVLEVGCGEGDIAERLHARFGDVTAIDLPDKTLRSSWHSHHGPRFAHADAHHLPFADDTFDLIVCVEVLEHLTDPDAGIAELARVARDHLLLSVPREPIFRLGNLATARHLPRLGNTPGHLNHWSTPAFLKFASRAGGIRDSAKPLPWTVAWVRHH